MTRVDKGIAFGLATICVAAYCWYLWDMRKSQRRLSDLGYKMQEWMYNKMKFSEIVEQNYGPQD